MSDGRVFRQVDGRWEPIGDPLPAWHHVPPRPRQPINVWVLPKAQGYRVRDVIAFGETGHRLLSLVPPDDVAWEEVIDAALAMNSAPHVREWAGQIELWLGMRLFRNLAVTQRATGSTSPVLGCRHEGSDRCSCRRRGRR